MRRGPSAEFALGLTSLVEGDFELLRQIGRHVVRVFDGEQVTAEIIIHKFSRKF